MKITDEMFLDARSAFHGVYDGTNPDTALRHALKDVVLSLEEKTVPNGWQIVPKQWTSEMAHAGYLVHQHQEIACAECGAIYIAMLAASPKPPDEAIAPMLAAQGEDELRRDLAQAHREAEYMVAQVHQMRERAEKAEAKLAAQPVAQTGVPEDASNEMADSVRYLLVAMEAPGTTFGKVRQHCEWSGMDTSQWPAWTRNRDNEHFNKAARASLIWHIMYRAAAPTPSKQSKEEVK